MPRFEKKCLFSDKLLVQKAEASEATLITALDDGNMADLKKYKFENLVLAEKIASILKEEIVKGRIDCGEQLLELEYQKMFNTSRSPIREAFRKLENLGIVDIVPRKGAFVKHLSQKDIEEIFPVRANLEGLAAKLAYAHKDSNFLKSLEQKINSMTIASESDDFMNFWREHNEFHDIFIKKSGNTILQDTLATLRTRNMWLRFTCKYFQEDLKRSTKIHKKILEMYRDKNTDIDELEFFMRKHIEMAKDRFLQYLQDSKIE